MTRRLLNFVASLSLVLSAAALLLWVRSYWWGDNFNVARWTTDGSIIHQRAVHLVSGKGGVCLLTAFLQFAPSESYDEVVTDGWPRPFHIPSEPNKYAGNYNFASWRDSGGRVLLGFGYDTRPTNGIGAASIHALIVPWPVVILAVGLPALWYHRSVRRRALRLRRSQCVRCGYDLRGTPGRCPECGAEPVPDAADKANAKRAQIGREEKNPPQMGHRSAQM